MLITEKIKGTNLITSFFLIISADMKVCDVDEDNSLLSMTPSQDGIPPPDPLRVDWPKVIYLHFTICMSKLDTNFKAFLLKE